VRRAYLEPDGEISVIQRVDSQVQEGKRSAAVR
jgi:uncharacterized membrane protein YcaP (DUF421 family)